ncbi:anaphase-promoting complex subunit 10 [Trametes coccinea BRFM310]|uniref:Anaphase-promoting complex subunit 10 n=1 Tax=Trametes coccinea (strain BRFM310) TaxID=1353009 RepID=A0A1Y2ID00_TRAC3|nr:anaphase-promoting complex subunit 10 [Trametes coccinea BRFM310]
MASASAVAPMPTVAVAARRRLAQPVPVGALPPGSEGAPVIFPGKAPPKLPFPDIGGLAKWSVSSFKFGFGPECLTDDDPDTFWHSDGPQPHYVSIEFPRKVSVQKLSIYLSYPLDDSYTPANIAIRGGTGPVDIQELRYVSLEKPDGWVTFDVCMEPSEDGEGFKHVDLYVLQILIINNHMNGKDTHVRGVKVLGPLEPKLKEHEEPFPFVTPPFTMYECIR